MAGSKRARSTSLAVEDTSREKQRKQALSRSSMEDDDVSVEYVLEEREEPEASTSKTTLEARLPPPQTTTTKRTVSKQSPIAEEDRADITSSSMKRNNSSRRGNAHAKRSVKDDPTRSRALEASNGEYEDLQARQRDLQAELKYVRKAHQELLDLRETAAEAALKAEVQLGTSRLEAQRKQTATYVKENEELKGQIESLREEVAQLSERLEKISRDQEASAVPAAGDVTADATMDASIADSSTAATGTKARRNDGELARRAEEAQTRNLELQEENESLKGQLEQMRREAKKNRKEWEADKASIKKAASDAFESEKRRLLADKEEIDARTAQLEKELAFEVQQSKKLQAMAGSTTAPTTSKEATTHQSGSNLVTEIGSEELIQLLLDFTGLTLIRRPTGNDKTYQFIMTDFKKKKALNFKMIVDRELGQVDFVPDLQAGRDDDVIEAMETAIRGHIKFEYEMLQTFFKRLWRALNGHK